MSKQIQKSLQECLSKIKISNKQIQSQLRRCKKPKTPSFSFALGGKEKEDADATVSENTVSEMEAKNAITLSDIDKFLFENFRSLYQKEYEEEKLKNDSKTAPFLFESPSLLEHPPPENLCRSDRFFIPTGSSGSIVLDEASSSSTFATKNSSSESSTEESSAEITAAAASASSAPEDFIALLTYSPNPYDDFRRSMQEMVDARLEHNGKVDWKFLEELLFCYLDLNNKKSYGFILRAFVDLIVVLRENAVRSPASHRPWSSGGRRRQFKERPSLIKHA